MPLVKRSAPSLSEAELGEILAQICGAGTTPWHQRRARALMMARIEMPSLAG